MIIHIPCENPLSLIVLDHNLKPLRHSNNSKTNPILENYIVVATNSGITMLKFSIDELRWEKCADRDIEEEVSNVSFTLFNGVPHLIAAFEGKNCVRVYDLPTLSWIWEGVLGDKDEL